MIRVGLILATTMALTGCASLSVDVSVLDPGYVRRAATVEQQRQLALSLAAGDRSEAERTFADLILARRSIRLKCYKAYAARGEALKAKAEDKKKLEDDLAMLRRYADSAAEEGKFDAAAAPVRDRLLQADAAVAAKVTPALSNPKASGEPLPADLIAALAVRSQAYQQAVDDALGRAAQCPTMALGGKLVVESVTELTPFEQQPVEKAAQTQSETIKRSIIGGGPLLSRMPEAYYVAQADDKAWTLKYNKAFGQGFGGGTDIVIKMNDQADFAVKGLVFDARATADMVRKVGTSTIGLIAAAYGAPVSFSAANGTKSAGLSFASDERIGSAEASIAVEKAREAAYRDALLHLANSVVAEWASLTDTDTTVAEAAHKRVTESFSSAKTSWSATQPTSP